ncbi:MAG: hypothetical protein LUE23_05720 [Lachnospiraceae bacterium]|nr:hypothetical protein [Lachnospiraceae bacterium]
MIRLVGRQTYNHAAVSLDGDLEHLYAFARPQQDAIFLGHLVRESLERYTLRQSDPVPVVILRIPISQEGYDWVTRRITQMVDNTEYMYNLLSVLFYPVTGGSRWIKPIPVWNLPRIYCSIVDICGKCGAAIIHPTIS